MSQVQTELHAKSRQAGMAEIATAVLHNVGNVLNSVNVSADLVSNQLRASKAQGLSRVAQLMSEHANDLGDFLTQDPKGKMLPDYLVKLAQAVTAEQQGIVQELGQLTKGIDHIKTIVAAQQSYAVAVSVVEAVSVTALIDDALRMSAGSLERQGVAVVKAIAELPLLSLDRHRVLLILVNLIGNAKHALEGVVDRSPSVTLKRAWMTHQHCAFQWPTTAAELPQSTWRGFFRMASPLAKTVTALVCTAAHSRHRKWGRLTVHSDGAGQGATFTLVIPLDASLSQG